MNNDSEIIVSQHSTTYIGPDAVALVRAAHLFAALRLYAKTGMQVTRNARPAQLLEWATQLTGKQYKGKDKYFTAADDVHKWVETMKAALPVLMEGDRPSPDAKAIYWSGSTPKGCDACGEPFLSSFVDAATYSGHWACLCADCARVHTRGTLGPGMGQKYELQPNGRWLKTGG
jgi:hypothetical protein